MKYLAVLFSFSFILIAPFVSAECFTPYQFMPGPVIYLWDLTVADFNNDGIDDIAAVSGNSESPRYDGNFDIYLSRGDGTFQPVKRFPASFGAIGIAAGDFNNDGNIDLIVVANPDDNENKEGIDLFLGNGDGTFRLGSRGGKQVRELSTAAVGDFDHDGNLDAVIAPYFTRRLGVLLGNGDGTMRDLMPISPGSFRPWALLVADFNGDGTLDVASISSNDQEFKDPILIYLGNGDGTFTFKTRVASHGDSPSNAVAGDFNQDGKIDLAVANTGNPLSSPGNVAILLGEGDGTFQPAVTYAAKTPWDIALADFNGDGQTDLVTNSYANRPVPNLSILMGNGDGTFQRAITSSNLAVGVFRSATGDFNHDGRPDLAFTDFYRVSFELNTGQCP
ncbi:MAG TPA: VCBS repeat-containing protein [Terriglobales bacterium]|jgi:hypothetical protein